MWSSLAKVAGGGMRRRGDAVVHITWPGAQAGACAQWLREWLR